ncbi:hypothetical protein [Longimicrobium sp.]|uniref:hypothetical protein n=1 Tax=Longimicrobium sp. TaxID=2029185 RepID=UPI003B3AF174
MKRIPLASAAVLLALAALPLSAQPVITGLDDLRWGATRDAAERYWRGVPILEYKVAEWEFLRMPDRDGMQWILGMHVSAGFQSFLARSVASPGDAECQRAFEQFVERMRRLAPGITPDGQVHNPGGGNLCQAVLARQGYARFVWKDPASGAVALVYIDHTSGRMTYVYQSPDVAASDRASGAIGTSTLFLMRDLPLPASGREVWNPQARLPTTLPLGAPGADILRYYGDPVRRDTENVGPGMTDHVYADSGRGGLVLTMHETAGLVRVIHSTGQTVPDLPCNAFWARARDRVAARMPGVTPRGGAHNPRGGDLCEQVKAGTAFAEMVWEDSAAGFTVWLRVDPSSGETSLAFQSPQFHQWFDGSPMGRERWERVNRAAGVR